MREMTLLLEEDIYSGLMQTVGIEKVNTFISNLVRPYVVSSSLENGYKAMAADEEHEKEAHEWCEALIGNTGL